MGARPNCGMQPTPGASLAGAADAAVRYAHSCTEVK